MTQNINILYFHFQADVFISFLKTYTCIQCLRLFGEGEAEVDTVHDCGGTVKGLIIQNDCSTFLEYMRRVCLPVNSSDNSGTEVQASGSAGGNEDHDNFGVDNQNSEEVATFSSQASNNLASELLGRDCCEPPSKRSRLTEEVSPQTEDEET